MENQFDKKSNFTFIKKFQKYISKTLNKYKILKRIMYLNTFI